MSSLEARLKALIDQLHSQGLPIPDDLQEAYNRVLPDFTETLPRKILAIFSGTQMDIIRQNPITGRDAVPFFDVLAALGHPVSEGRCNSHWQNLRNFDTAR